MIINEEPLIFRKEIYGTACLAGGLLYILLLHIPAIDIAISQIASIVVVIIIRLLAIKNNWSLRNIA